MDHAISICGMWHIATHSLSSLSTEWLIYWHLSRLELKVTMGRWVRHLYRRHFSVAKILLNLWQYTFTHELASWLVGADCEGLRLLIELRICCDPGAASFICLIIVEEGEDEGGGKEWSLAIRFHSKSWVLKPAVYLWRMSPKINCKWSIWSGPALL